MQYSAAFCTPQVISKGSTCKIKIHLCNQNVIESKFSNGDIWLCPAFQSNSTSVIFSIHQWASSY